MPKIPSLPVMTAAAGADQLPIEDSSASTTKSLTLTLLQEFLTVTYDKVSLTKATQTINNNTDTTLTWTAETYDTAGMHSNSVDTSRVTIQHDGYYIVDANIVFDNNATGLRVVRLYKNGSLVRQITHTIEANDDDWMGLCFVLHLIATDYLEIVVYQNRGGTLDVLSSSTFTVTGIPN